MDTQASTAQMKRVPRQPLRLAIALLSTPLVTSVAACALPAAPPRAPAPPPAAAPAPPPIDEAEIDREVDDALRAGVAFEPWRPAAAGASYLAAKGAVDEDGGVDVVFHFHGGMMAEREWRASGVRAVLVSAAYGTYGTTPYREAFGGTGRFDTIVDDVLRRVGADHVRRLALVSWSAGYAATQEVLRDPRWYAKVDTVVLLDGLHTDYVDGHHVDLAALAPFDRFARDAVDGAKTMVITHSSIVPPNYASTTETAAALLDELALPRVEEARTNARGMRELYHVDRGNLHVRGFRGVGPSDHVDQLRLVGDVAREHLAPRWARLAAIERHERAAATARGDAPPSRQPFLRTISSLSAPANPVQAR